MGKSKEINIASNPIVDHKLPHLKLDIRENYPDTFFLPGDPERVMFFKERSENFRVIANNREFKTAVGTYKGFPYGVVSTGIGSGSTEIAVVELGRCGVKNLIRVGGCGALQKEIDCGDFIINTGSMRRGGASKHYVSAEFPAVADPFICKALADSTLELNQKYHMGIGASVDSYYEGQYRNSLDNRSYDYSKELDSLIRNNVLNFDMETETIFTLAYLFKMRAGSLLGVHGNRVTDRWLVDYEQTQKMVIDIALNSLKLI